MTVGSHQDAREALPPSALSGVAAVDAFKALCLSDAIDEAGFAKIAQASPLQLQSQVVVLEPLGQTPTYTSTRYVGQGVIASWWSGDDKGLKNRPIGIRDRGASTTSVYGPFKASGRQCNVSMKLAQVGDLQSMADRLGAAAGGASMKVVVKPKWADGSWAMPGSAKRISFAVVDAETSSALIHLTVQEIEGAKP